MNAETDRVAHYVRRLPGLWPRTWVSLFGGKGVTRYNSRQPAVINMDPVDGQYYEIAKPGSLAEKITALAREQIYQDFIRICAPDASDKILDVGVSDILGDAANVLERRYALQRNLTAVGLGEGRGFRKSFPEVKYYQIVANQRLPFPDRSFNIVTSNAVLEHVGSFEKQRFFVSELLRVGERVFITVPNRFFPVEHHTGIPFLHWSDVSFKFACRALQKEKWSSPDNLILLSRRRLLSIGLSRNVKIGSTGIKLGPWSSNLFLFADGLSS